MAKKDQHREGSYSDHPGRYTYDLDRMCVCGHTFGQHAGAGPVKIRECFVDDCECEGFRASRKKRSR
jgi:hypothetical protein